MQASITRDSFQPNAINPIAMKLVIFDCDGTLVDSQRVIVAAIEYAFRAVGLEPPSRAEALSVVGLSLPETFRVLAGVHPASVQRELVELYRSGGPRIRQDTSMAEPLYPGIRDAIQALKTSGAAVLGIATGKSKRGVARLFEREGWHGHFLTIQTADDHPSKPHPSMILKAMSEAGVAACDTVMVGDTSFDMEMARSAGVGALGVAWGYHAIDRLTAAGAHSIVRDGMGLLAAIEAHFAVREADA